MGEEREGHLGGHEWKQNVLEPKSQWMEDQEASRPGPWGQPGLFPLWDCLLPQHLLILWGLLKEPGRLPVSWS